MSSLDYFTRGIIRASARHKEQQSKQNAQHVQRADSDTSNIVTTTNTRQSSDRLCKAIIIQEMISLIKKRKMK
jgi:hypothetical protein